jgi:Tfp pilus assembly protein PilV
MVAVVILTIAFLAWSGSMMGASQGQYHAAKHTEAIEIANYYLEQMRRDPEFWAAGGTGNTGEFIGPTGCPSNNCWVNASPVETDNCGVSLAPYSDTGPTTGTWHTGCTQLDDQGTGGAVANEPYNYQWRADIHGRGTTAEDDAAADVTVWVETQTLHGGWDIYEVTGTIREPR